MCLSVGFSCASSFPASGCKFTAEEEKMVIELQAQFGNKWAKIATYLPGRTDNDVKNFWSSRQKRLARLLQTSPAPSKLQRSAKKETPVDFDIPTMEVFSLLISSDILDLRFLAVL